MARSSRPPLSVRRVFLTLMGSTLQLQACVSGFLLAMAWDRFRLAQAVEYVNDVGDGIASAIPSLGLERGRTNALLHDAASASAADVARLVDLRGLSEADLDRSEQVLRKRASDELPAFLRARAALSRHRTEVDEAIARPLARRDRLIVDQWVAHSGLAMRELSDVVERTSAAHLGQDLQFDAINLMRSNAITLRFVAGDESARYTGLLNRGGVPSRPEWVGLPQLRSRTQQAWNAQSGQGLLLLDPGIAQARREIETALVGTLMALQDQMLDAWSHGRPAPVAPADYARTSAQSLNTVAALVRAVATAESVYARTLMQYAGLYFVAACAAVAAAGLLVLITIRRVARLIVTPLERLAESAHRVEQGEDAVRIPEDGVHEVQVLARQMEAMVRAQADHMQVISAHNDNLESTVARRTEELVQALAHLQATQEQLVRSAKMASLGSIVAGVAHELNTPIGNALLSVTAMRDASDTFVTKLQRGLMRSELDAYLRYLADGHALIERNMTAASTLVDRFKEVAADRVSERRRTFALADTVHACLAMIEPSIRDARIQVESDISADIEMDSYPGSLHHVISNLVLNAAVHAFEGVDDRVVRIEARRLGTALQLDVCDNWRGIAPADLSRIFDPFFTSRLGQGGTGLGLTIVLNLVENVLGGHIEVDSQPGGTRFRMHLPLQTLGADHTNNGPEAP